VNGGIRNAGLHYGLPLTDFDSHWKLRSSWGKFCAMIELMTIGYEGMTLKDFLEVLKFAQVSMLVDVRELPISRKPGFAKSALTAALELQAIRYEHLVKLGCPRDIRHNYRADGDWARYTEKYKAYLDTQAPALAYLWSLMQKNRCCLMCFEADYHFCHRSYIAQRMSTIADTPMTVLHLTGPPMN